MSCKNSFEYEWDCEWNQINGLICENWSTLNRAYFCSFWNMVDFTQWESGKIITRHGNGGTFFVEWGYSKAIKTQAHYTSKCK